MKIKKPVLIVLGEPNSVFVEILSKVLKNNEIKRKIKYPIILIGSYNLIRSQLKILKKNIKMEVIDKEFLKNNKLHKKIYLMNVKYNFKKAFEKISFKSKNYISTSFKEGLNLLNLGISNTIINGPISKKHFLKGQYPGITEYIFKKSKTKSLKKPVMLIYNKNFSVSPLSTHAFKKSKKKKY